MARVLVALGSNLGDRLDHLRQAVEALRSYVDVEAVGGVYETAPMYVADQPAFYNTALIGTTDLGPWPLLKAMKGIEQDLGRQARARNGPREIDVDLIAYGRAHVIFRPGGERLEVPHPRARERRFVLAPLADIASDFEIVGQGRINDLLPATETQLGSVLLTGHAVLSL
ncbi:MAG: 2-amino-4-hydroxy-6-hydroxymethyldihydropteridine diphosphokinase [Caulobacteraceae bacterium]|nr:MAG: 2-amino-4-hydroxy-6-hydroxymethyldihydropteridine diphosphokinase [Caulobacteraceae bacterium]